MLYPFLLSLFLLVAPLEGGDVETKDAFRLHPISYQYSHVMVSDVSMPVVIIVGLAVSCSVEV